MQGSCSPSARTRGQGEGGVFGGRGAVRRPPLPPPSPPPSFADLGMQKILPDTSFLAQWRDRIEAVFITHGHEDHIGALPWVLPALDPATPVYAGAFPMQLVRRRALEYNMWGDGRRFITVAVGERFALGPFECEPLRVTHSIPDCMGFALRCEHGTIVHTGDWKIDEHPLDGQTFDRAGFEALAAEGVSLFMSDSTNVLSPGRTVSEASVERRLAERVLGHAGKGRIVATQFASNVHRLGALKRAADAAGRRVCFMGMSLHAYLAAAHRVGLAPFDPAELVSAADAESLDPSQLLVVTTGSQAEPRAARALAAHGAAPTLKLGADDLVLYSAKVIPGNETRVTEMMNAVAARGATIAMKRDEGLHSSGHACRDELEEVLRLVKPHHFLPVHGEYSFLCEHANLARSTGVRNTSVIRNGQMLGLSPTGTGASTAGSSLLGGAHGGRGAAPRPIGPPPAGGGRAYDVRVIGEADLTTFYNDGHRGTGTAAEMALDERTRLATDGVIVAAVDVARGPPPARGGGDARPAGPPRLRARVRLTTRAMWVDSGRFLERLVTVAESAVGRLPPDAALAAVERVVGDALRREARSYNAKRPEVVVIAHEFDPRAGAALRSRRGGDGGGGDGGGRSDRGGGDRRSDRPPPARRARPATATPTAGDMSDGGGSTDGAPSDGDAPPRRRSRPRRADGAAPPAVPAPDALLRRRKAANPREDPDAAAAAGVDVSFG